MRIKNNNYDCTLKELALRDKQFFIDMLLGTFSKLELENIKHAIDLKLNLKRNNYEDYQK